MSKAARKSFRRDCLSKAAGRADNFYQQLLAEISTAFNREGWMPAEIAEATGLTEKQVRKMIKEARNNGS